MKTKPNLFVIYPNRYDVRWLLLTFLASYAIYAVQWPGYTRTLQQFAAAVGTCLSVDLLLLYFKGLPLLPVSGLVSSMGVFLLCDSPTIWAYVLVAAVSISSKHLLRNRLRHIFNPNNFGIVLGVLFFPGFITTTMGRWGGSALGASCIASLGILVIYRARRFVLVLSYVMTFILGVFARCVYLEREFLVIAGPMTGAAFQLFIFYMLPDPVTTPLKKREQLVFGVALGCIDTCFRLFQVKYAPFFSLFILCGVYAFLQDVFGPSDTRVNCWPLKEVQLKSPLRQRPQNELISVS